MEREQVNDVDLDDRGWAFLLLPGVASGVMAGLAVLVRDRVFMASYAHLRAPWEFVLDSGPHWFVAAAVGLLLGATIGPATGALDRVASRRSGASMRTLALVLVAVAAVGLRLALVRHGHADLWLDIGILTCVLLVVNPRLDEERASAIGWTVAAGSGVLVATAIFFTANKLLNDIDALLLQIPAYAVTVAVSVFVAHRAHRLLNLPLQRAAEGIGPAGAAAAIVAIAILPGLLLSGTDAWTADEFEQQLAQLPAAPQSGEATDRPNVILISVDTLRADHVGFMGGPVRTPTMDAIAEESYVFERAYAVAPWTRPSFAAFFSGRYPYEMGIARSRTNDTAYTDAIPYRWREDRDLLAEVLREEGYETAAVVTNTQLTREAAADQGFDFYYNCREQGSPPALPGLIREALGIGEEPMDERERANEVTLRSREVMSRGGRPVLLWLHYMDPHDPYDAPGAPPEAQVVDEFTWAKAGAYARVGTTRQWFLRAYRAEVEFNDRWLEPVVEALKHEGLWDNSIVVFWSDHGEEFWEHGHWHHGQSLFHEQLHVPLTIHLPGQTESRRITQPVSLLDVMPTLLDLCEVGDPPEMLRGRSLTPVLRPEGGDLGEFRVFLEGCTWGAIRKGLLTDRYKLIYNVYHDRFSLYDLQEDPGELHDIWGTDLAPETTQWETELQAWTEVSLTEMARLEGQAAEELSPEVRQGLKDMGYIQ